jgi:hypothetical protein
MSEGKTRFKWNRILFLVLKVYAGLCAVVVTGVLALILWAYLIPTSATEDHDGANEPAAKVWSPPSVDLNYDLPRVPASGEGLFRISPEPDGLPKTGGHQPDGAANQSQPARPETNRTSTVPRQ